MAELKIRQGGNFDCVVFIKSCGRYGFYDSSLQEDFDIRFFAFWALGFSFDDAGMMALFGFTGN